MLIFFDKAFKEIKSLHLKLEFMPDNKAMIYINSYKAKI